MIRFDNNNYFAYERIGEFRTSDIWIHPTRVIASYELILVKEGTVYLQENEAEYELHTGDMILLEPNRKHGGYKSSQSKISFYWFHFQTNIPLPFKTATCQNLYNVHHYIKKLLDDTNNGFGTCETADTLGFIIFNEISKAESQNHSDIQSITEFIRINRNKDISIAQIAEEFGYNPDYLGRLFKKHKNIGLKDYLLLTRLSYAKELLLTTSLPVKEIAKMLGYENANLFIKFFSYHEKITPKNFRKLYEYTHLNSK